MPNVQTITTYTTSQRPAELVTNLQKHLMQTNQHEVWQLCFLNNDHRPIIGIAPRLSWTVSPLSAMSANESSEDKADAKLTQYAINTRHRQLDNQSHTNPRLTNTEQRKSQTYLAWTDDLIVYAEGYAKNNMRNAKESGWLSADANFNNNSNSNVQYSTADNSEFTGGLMGFIGYDLSAQALSPNCNAIHNANQPLAYLGHYDIWLSLTETTANPSDNPSASPDEQSWTIFVSCEADVNVVQTVRHTLDKFFECLCPTIVNQQKVSPSPVTSTINLSPTWTFDEYAHAFEQVQHHLYAGDSYQINLTQPWQGKLPHQQTLLDFLPALDAKTHAPFAGFMAVDGFELVSCSPELFLTFTSSVDGVQISTKPIKGTRPRGQTPQTDDALKNELATSDKDRAENVMIVDLLRNDLGKVAKTGTVDVPKLFEIESFANVHHLVSTVTATLTNDTHPLQALFASLPAGSVTGTPKKRSVELIGEIESQPRGAYCGTMGFMNFYQLNTRADGHSIPDKTLGKWNVLIRTVQKQADGQVNVWAGGGITVGSTCEAEYQECVDKVGNLLAVLGGEEGDDEN